MPDSRGATRRPEPTCPVEVALAALDGRWTTLVLRELMHGPRSFTALRQALPPLSAKVLTERLAGLERHTLVERRRQSGFPSRTEYRLTPAGQQLRPLLVQLYQTGSALLQAQWPSDRDSRSGDLTHQRSTTRRDFLTPHRFDDHDRR